MAFTPPTLASETIAKIGSFSLRNSMVMAWLAMILLITGVLILRKKGLKMIPRGFQNFVETIVEGLFNFFDSVTQDKKQTKRFFPIVATIFIFILTANWMGILPGVGSIGFYEKHEEAALVEEKTGEQTAGKIEIAEKLPKTTLKGEFTPEIKQNRDTEGPEESDESIAHEEEKLIFVPYFRSAYADVNMTLALAIISVIATQIFGILSLGFRNYAGKFFINPFKNFIGSFVGILELVSEFAKMISFSFRLFGNIFAGEILLMVISFLAPFLAPLPFYGLEIFVGLVQALVFSLLTLVFMKMAITSHHEEA